MIWAVRSSGLMLVMEPLNARPIGDRAVATTTASGMSSASLGGGHLLLISSLRRRWLAARVARGSDNVGDTARRTRRGRPPEPMAPGPFEGSRRACTYTTP